MDEANLKRATVVFTDGSGGMMQCIEHAGQTWLVVRWNEAPAEGWKIPARTVLLASLTHQVLPPGNPLGHYFVQTVLPTQLMHATPWQGPGPFVVEESPPPIQISIPRGMH